MLDKICHQCKKEFQRTHKDAIFCSKKCHYTIHKLKKQKGGE